MKYLLGLMSGTSLDGLDIVLTDSRSFRTQAFTTQPYPKSLQQRLERVMQTPTTAFQNVMELDRELGVFFSDAVAGFLAEHRVEYHQILAIGSHGQTVLHQPHTEASKNLTVQLGDVSFMAARFDVSVVSDFRHNDMTLGGQGAPLAPLFHGALFEGEGWACINLGGISNVSLRQKNNLYGYDIGPANRLIDDVMQELFQKQYDDDGQVAASGNVDAAVLEQMLTEPYFAQVAPKSTGRELFNRDWLKAISGFSSLSAQDKVSTLTELTARTISDDLQHYRSIKSIWLCGGGALNGHLMARLQMLLPEHRIQTTANMGIDPQAVEALLIAWLAYQRINLCRLDLTKVTGAQRPGLLGTLTQV